MLILHDVAIEVHLVGDYRRKKLSPECILKIDIRKVRTKSIGAFQWK